MDAFAEWPNELLEQVFKHVESLRDKFKLAAVNQKFRRVIMKMMVNPMPLDMNYAKKSINGVKVAYKRWLPAVEVLAERTSFKEIKIHDGEWPVGLLDSIMHVIINDEDCLERTTLIQNEAIGGCSSGAFTQLLEQCPLWGLHWNSPISRMPHPTAHTIDLRGALGNKALVSLELKLEQYPLAELSAFFKSLQPNTLEFCGLEIRYPLDLVQLIKELSGSAWEALEALCIQMDMSGRLQLDLLRTIAQLPALRECNIFAYALTDDGLDLVLPFELFAGALVSLFNAPTPAEELTLSLCYPLGPVVLGCSAIELVRLLQNQHPDLQFNHSERFSFLEFSLENLKLSYYCGITTHCCGDCVECHAFFPTVVRALATLAGKNQDNGQLDGYQLDKCRVGRVVEAVNGLVEDCTALSALSNQAQDSATIAFETEKGQKFKITVDCGSCFNDMCAECLI